MRESIKKKSKGRNIKKEMLEKIKNVFNDNPTKNLNYKQVAKILGTSDKNIKSLIIELLEQLSVQNFLHETSKGKYRVNTRKGYIIGTIEREGVKTYLAPDDEGKKIFIPERKTNHAMLGDKVKVYLYAHKLGQLPEGEVMEIISRAHETIVGTLDVSEHYAFLMVNNKIMNGDIFIPKEKLKGAKNRQKVIVKLLDWQPRKKSQIGEVIDILGNKGDNETEMHAILAEFGLPYKYPEKIEAEAAKIEAGITAEEIKKRVDMRKITTFTIDPKDAKDFDDALSIQKLENGHWEIGVHIADVSHYVKEGSAIDLEAEKRATSVYLVDRTIPMLPEHLSNGICSLRPDEEKLTYSVIYQMDENAQIINYKIAKTVTKSDRRFTYEEAQQRIQTKEGDYQEEINILNDLAQKLRAERFKKGAISFDRTEVRFNLSPEGKPIGVYFKKSQDANKLVEEFMLLANKTVATHIGKTARGEKKKTFIYRIHDLPNPDKLDNFSKFIKIFGYNLKTTVNKNKLSGEINKLLSEVEGKKEQNLFETLAVRTMAKAAYSTTNIGHYGLSFPYYSHFTSPIRRYPDTMLHRLLYKYSQHQPSADKNEYEEKCIHCSEREQVAANAERASIKYKQVEFLSDKKGQIFDGVISGITEWGIYVEIIENKCEGMIPIRDLDDDFYEMDEKNYCLIGRRNHKIYRLGDELKIRITRTNLDKKQVDFELIEK